MESRSASDAVAVMARSCDRYLDLPDRFLDCLRKYWPDRPYSAMRAHGAIKGHWYWPATGILKKEGFGHTLEGRDRLGLKAFSYIHAFKLHNFVFRALKKHWY